MMNSETHASSSLTVSQNANEPTTAVSNKDKRIPPLRNSCKNCPQICKGRVAKPFPYRVHILYPTDYNPVPVCECDHQHMIYGETYQYCTCGMSEKQPFCDASCAGTEWKPMEFTVDKQQSWYLLCGCKQTETPPHCDGSHIHIDWATINNW